MDLNLNFNSTLGPSDPNLDFGSNPNLELPFLSSNIDDILMRLPSVDLHPPVEEQAIELENVFDSFDNPPTINNEHLPQTGVPRLRRERITVEHLSAMARTRANEITRIDSSHNIDSATDPERLIHNIRRSARLIAASKQKATSKDSDIEGLADEKKEKKEEATDFDCNVCFEVAKEPVVTCCGHLFCWPCLFQWLHVHCGNGECPVCKGNVSESSIVPIYGRGSPNVNSGEELEGLKIPPRPQGQRVESFRQQLHALRGRRDMIVRGMQEYLYPPEFNLHSRGNSVNPQTLVRNNVLVGPVRNRTVVSENPRTINVNNNLDLRVQDNSHSQASTSSTIAVIEGEIRANSDVSLGTANNGGSSMSLRRTARFRGPSSLDSSGSDGPRPRQRRRRN